MYLFLFLSMLLDLSLLRLMSVSLCEGNLSQVGCVFVEELG